MRKKNFNFHHSKTIKACIKQSIKKIKNNPEKFLEEFDTYSYYEWVDYLKTPKEIIPSTIKKKIENQLIVEDKEMKQEVIKWQYHPLMILSSLIIKEGKGAIKWISKGEWGNIIKDILEVITDFSKNSTERVIIIGWLCGFILEQKHKIEGLSKYIEVVNKRRKNDRDRTL